MLPQDDKMHKKDWVSVHQNTSVDWMVELTMLPSNPDKFKRTE